MKAPNVIDASDGKCTMNAKGAATSSTGSNNNGTGEGVVEENHIHEHPETEPNVVDATSVRPPPPPPPPPPPKPRRTVETVMEHPMVQPAKHSAHAVLDQVGALRQDVTSDVKELGQLVFQPVVDIARRSAPTRFMVPSLTSAGPRRICSNEPTVPTWPPKPSPPHGTRS